MGEQRSRWMATAVVAAIAGLFSAGCGSWEEAEYPQHHYVPPEPPTAEELAAQQRAREQAAAENREILVGADDDEYADTDPSALTEWRPVLEGHGTWVDDPVYGTVWVPSPDEVGPDFQPYVTAGHWTYSETTDYVWVSDYSWGWVPFHYGRWVYLPKHGWAWIPGRRYAGAWVTWRVGPAGYGYVGWAPAPPTWYWYHGVAVGWSFGFYRSYDYYVYCPHDHLYQPTVATHVVRGPSARVHYERTHNYVPASPSVGGGDRVIANPSVGGGERVIANPSVGGGRVIAQPSVGGGRVVASPAVAKGPRPDELGLSDAVIVAPPASHQGIARAQAFAAPRTAVAAGAKPPVHWSSAAASPSSNGLGREPASAAFVPRESFSAPAVVAPYRPAPDAIASSMTAPRRSTPLPPYPGVTRPPSSLPSSSSILGPRSSSTIAASPSASFRSGPLPSLGSSRSMTASPSPSASFRSGPLPSLGSSRSMTASPSPSASFRTSPTFRSSPSIGASPSIRSTPFFRSAPTFRASPSARSAPSVRPSSSPTFRAFRSSAGKR